MKMRFLIKTLLIEIVFPRYVYIVRRWINLDYFKNIEQAYGLSSHVDCTQPSYIDCFLVVANAWRT